MADVFGMLGTLERPALILNYILLAATFVDGYFRPKESTEWLATSSITYVIMLVAVMFLTAISFSLGMVLPDILASGFGLTYLALFVVPQVGISAFLLVAIVRSRMKLAGGAWAVSFALYLFSLAQETYGIAAKAAFAAPGAAVLQMGLWMLAWYFFGIFVVALGGELAGKRVDGMFGSIAAEHIALMKEKFGPDAPDVLRFRDGSRAGGGLGPGKCMAMGVIYALWMMIGHLLFA